ncbi:hypothetical protein ACFY30_39050 [Streptomyces sp. NPDC000345]|uniref:hypothetical protein n=1 Tax=Streptomyces sp. NPDC000345 TaxID=3364537 RepID=UPI00368BA5E9
MLFWEESGGQASHVWSCLQVLRHAGILDRIAGMVVGIPGRPGVAAIDGLDAPDASPTLRETVLDVLGDRDIPVLGNVEVGHAGPDLPMPVGIRVALDAHRRTLSLLEPAVRPLTGPDRAAEHCGSVGSCMGPVQPAGQADADWLSGDHHPMGGHFERAR